MSQAKAFKSPTQDSFNTSDSDHERDFHGAAVIDKDGREIPITEEMIQQACKDLGNAWLFPRQAHQH